MYFLVKPLVNRNFRILYLHFTFLEPETATCKITGDISEDKMVDSLKLKNINIWIIDAEIEDNLFLYFISPVFGKIMIF